MVLGGPSLSGVVGAPVYPQKAVRADKLTYHHKQLRQQDRTTALGFPRLGVLPGVRTEEGHGVLHIFWAWRVPDEVNAPAGVWISQEWLSAPQWQREGLHGGAGGLDPGLPAGASLREPPTRADMSSANTFQDQSGYVNMMVVVETVARLPMSTLWERRAINGRAGMRFVGYEVKSKSLAWCSSRPGKTMLAGHCRHRFDGFDSATRPRQRPCFLQA